MSHDAKGRLNLTRILTREADEMIAQLSMHLRIQQERLVQFNVLYDMI